MATPARPALSVIVALVSDTVRRAETRQLRSCLESLTQQIDAPSIEILVPHYPGISGMDELRQEYQGVRFLEISDLKRHTGRPGREHHNELRGRGVAAAQGEIIALIEDNGFAAPDWCARIVEAHRNPAASIGGAIENRIDRPLNWALGFCDFGQYQLPLPAGETWLASDANVSYKRGALESIRPVWREVFHEGAINHALKLRGESVLLDPALVVYQNRLDLDLPTALRERYIWGHSYGAGRALSGPARLIWSGLSLALPFLLTARMAKTALAKGRHTGAFFRSLPWTMLAAGAWAAGELIAYLTGARIEGEKRAEPEDAALPSNPRLSVVVVPAGSETMEPAALEGLERQKAGRPFEVFVPCAVEAVPASFESRYSGVRFLRVNPASPAGSAERLDELRALGVAAAQGDLIAVIEDHVRPDPDWSGEVIQAHRQGYAAIGGAVENGVDRLLHWATYFTDLGRYHNPLPAGDSSFATVVNVSYKRTALEDIRAVWQRRFSETAVHSALLASGARLALSPRIVVRQIRGSVSLGGSLRDFYTWGRSYGSIRVKMSGGIKRLIFICLSPLIPVSLLLRSGLDVLRKKRLLSQWLKSLPVSAALTAAWSCGELVGYVAGEAPARPAGALRKSQAAR
jgi:hypothetical protein